MQNLCISYYNAGEKRREDNQNDNQNIEYRMRYENIVVCLVDFPFSFIPFVLNLAKELIKYRLPEFFGLLLRTLGSS
ncbi:hypothetical protein AAH055_20070 [Bacteroides uniformis]